MSDQELSPAMQEMLKHQSGKHVVVEYEYVDGKGPRYLLEEMGESPEFEAWDDAAFTNGPHLVAIKLRWDQKAAAELRLQTAVELMKRETGMSEPELDFDWTKDDPGTCSVCGAPHEHVRPGKTQPTCECDMLCSIRHVRIEYRAEPHGHTGDGHFGYLCPICFPDR